MERRGGAIKGSETRRSSASTFPSSTRPRPSATAWPQRELELATPEGRFEDEGWRVRKDGSRFWANVVLTGVRDATAPSSGSRR